MSLRYCPKCSHQTMSFTRYLLGGIGRQNHQCPSCKAILKIGSRYRIVAVAAAVLILYYIIRALGPGLLGDPMPNWVAVLLVLCLAVLAGATNYFVASWRENPQSLGRNR